MRHKDYNWDMPEGTKVPGGSQHSWDSMKVSLMMDLRDELKKLNRILSCPNFIGIPLVLDKIRRNTTRAKRIKKA